MALDYMDKWRNWSLYSTFLFLYAIIKYFLAFAYI
jgi:hypothetical protein